MSSETDVGLVWFNQTHDDVDVVVFNHGWRAMLLRLRLRSIGVKLRSALNQSGPSSFRADAELRRAVLAPSTLRSEDWRRGRDSNPR